MSNDRTLVLYHGKCADGFGAAFAAWLKLGDAADYLACHYGDPPPVVEGREVFILDYSFEPEVLRAMGTQARSITLLDHHVSAQKRLQGLELACPHRLYFDLSRSGAAIAWEHFHPGEPLPYLLQAIQARDLWRWDVPDARPFLAALDLLPLDFAAWKSVLDLDAPARARMVERGAAMEARFDALCTAIAEQPAAIRIDGEAGLMVNAPGEFASNVGSLLAQRSGTFALVWRADHQGRLKCSLRSVQGFDVERLAARFGGGGHAQAAAFILPGARVAEVLRGELQSAGAGA
ncbi:DHHA1 domain-containing protein [uncultured Azohydromonas sp.]|jgi:Predicted phosphohydrolase (DHH superfamily)|uniref:DHHA1 domain-containing protein n=1 Tax=uncultured Azohydromonas sp. TaxID=487342 RepID=UPI002620D66A|nr:DHHA1 domain-containing protein [uncultured Azohydromonas sp.]